MDTPDTVSIENLEIDAVIGAYDWEREIEQRLVLTIEMATSAAAPAGSDSLDDVFVDYAEVAAGVRTHVQEGRFHLIETLAESVASLILDGFAVAWVRLRVQKPRPSEGFQATLMIERRAG